MKALTLKRGGTYTFFQPEFMRTLLGELMASPACELSHTWNSPLCKTWSTWTLLPCKC